MIYGSKGAMVSLKSSVRTAGAKDGIRQTAARKSPKQMVSTELTTNQKVSALKLMFFFMSGLPHDTAQRAASWDVSMKVMIF
jgi:hypothetical protein